MAKYAHCVPLLSPSFPVNRPGFRGGCIVKVRPGFGVLGDLPKVVFLSLGRWNIPNRLQQSVVVEPGHPFKATHSCSVWGTQPILGAIDSMAAHSDGYMVLLHHAYSAFANFRGKTI